MREKNEMEPEVNEIDKRLMMGFSVSLPKVWRGHIISICNVTKSFCVSFVNLLFIEMRVGKQRDMLAGYSCPYACHLHVHTITTHTHSVCVLYVHSAYTFSHLWRVSVCVYVSVCCSCLWAHVHCVYVWLEQLIPSARKCPAARIWTWESVRCSVDMWHGAKLGTQPLSISMAQHCPFTATALPETGLECCEKTAFCQKQVWDAANKNTPLPKTCP